MKNSLACPKCDSRKLWRIEKLRSETDNIGGRVIPASITRKVSEGFFSGGGEHIVGHFELFACAACGYSELWTSGLDGLAHDPAQGVHLIDTTPQQGKYR